MDRGSLWSAIGGVFVALFFWWYSLLGSGILTLEYSTSVFDVHGELLGARLGPSQQWRLPPPDTLPPLYVQALIAFEDKRFYQHIGIDFWALGRAMIQNLRHGTIVSGGSTITMQLARIMMGNQPRTPLQKVKEMALATRLEWSFSKEEILRQYATRAPYGGNIIGIEAASWRYFRTTALQLSLSESVLMALLPNAPGWLAPGKNESILRNRRDNLLDQLCKLRVIDPLQCKMAKMESIPSKPEAMPNRAIHAVEWLHQQGPGEQHFTTIDAGIQIELERLAHHYQQRNAPHGVENIAILVAEVETGNVVGYVGNDPDGQSPWVDIVQAQRSSGSILKPFLFCHLYDEGFLIQETLVPDYPVYLQGFNPKNFDKQYRGALPAREALAQSLNIPSVLLLRKFGIEPFQKKLNHWGFSTINRPSSHYGLSLILGGAEVTLWDAVGAYASMARLNQSFLRNGAQYDSRSIHPLNLNAHKKNGSSELQARPRFVHAGAVNWVLHDLQEVSRPDEVIEAGLQPLNGIGWKTGTSFGQRDAWAIGVNQTYAVGVWVGNASGEGKNGLIGARYAAPILFEVMRSMGGEPLTSDPLPTTVDLEVCYKSGYLWGPFCGTPRFTQGLPKSANMGACPYHVYSPDYEMNKEGYFVLPPTMAHYFTMPQNRHYRLERNMDFIYPKDLEFVSLPIDGTGKRCSAVFELAHRLPAAKVFWFLNGVLTQTTTSSHTISIQEPTGRHKLLVIDDLGEELLLEFEVLPN